MRVDSLSLFLFSHYYYIEKNNNSNFLNVEE